LKEALVGRETEMKMEELPYQNVGRVHWREEDEFLGRLVAILMRK